MVLQKLIRSLLVLTACRAQEYAVNDDRGLSAGIELHGAMQWQQASSGEFGLPPYSAEDSTKDIGGADGKFGMLRKSAYARKEFA